MQLQCTQTDSTIAFRKLKRLEKVTASMLNTAYVSKTIDKFVNYIAMFQHQLQHYWFHK